MSYGLSIKNSSGVLQIEEGMSNYVIKSSGVIASGTLNSSVGALANKSAGELLLLRPSSNTGSIRLSTSGSSTPVLSCTSGNITYIVAAVSKNMTPSSTSYGLRVKGAASDLIYDSGTKIASPIANLVFPIVNWVAFPRPTINPTFSSPREGRLRYMEYSFTAPLAIRPLQINVANWLYPRCTWNSQTSFTIDIVETAGAPPAPYGWNYEATKQMYVFEV